MKFKAIIHNAKNGNTAIDSVGFDTETEAHAAGDAGLTFYQGSHYSVEEYDEHAEPPVVSKPAQEKTSWQLIEEEARRLENVGDDYSLRWAKIDSPDDSAENEYAEYRLRKMSGKYEGQVRTGKIENFAALRPQ